MGNCKKKIETENANTDTLAFTTKNYLLILIGILLILIGLYLMSGDGSTQSAFNPDIFSHRRIQLAPSICLLGYLFEVYAILK